MDNERLDRVIKAAILVALLVGALALLSGCAGFEHEYRNMF